MNDFLTMCCQLAAKVTLQLTMSGVWLLYNMFCLTGTCMIPVN